MTALSQRIKEAPMAPYAALLRGMTREQKQTVVTFITESMDEPQVKSNAELIREKYKNLKTSPETLWFREHAAGHEWNPQEAWNRLTDAQREEVATKLNLGPEKYLAGLEPCRKDSDVCRRHVLCHHVLSTSPSHERGCSPDFRASFYLFRSSVKWHYKIA